MNLKKLFLIIITALLFSWLFFKSQIGVNLLIFNLIVIIGLFLSGKISFKRNLNLIILEGTILTAFFVVFNGSVLAITVNIISLFLLAGTSLYHEGKNLIYSALLSVINFFNSQMVFLHLLSNVTKNIKGVSRIVRILKIVIIPIIIVLVFILIYRAANPVFEGIVKSAFDSIDDFFTMLFSNVNFALFWTFIFGLVLANYYYLGKPNNFITDDEKMRSFNLIRKRNKSSRNFKVTSLKNEYKSAIILFVLLNILILVVNVIDIWWVWFNFSWDGEYLKQFVHEGTYLLILSIIISLAISIYYFRGNINFLMRNVLLKRLAYMWLFQNAILTISVGIRNYWYINYFSLAYLRIGVVFFLLLTLFSIVTVLIKIRDKKSTYYLFGKNATAAYILLIVMAFFNWDIIIAKYNFSHSQSSFIHFNFMSGLSESSLPFLDKSKIELAEIDNVQKQDFPFRDQYMTSGEYYYEINNRKTLFLEAWPQQKWQEWNWAGERSYKRLSKED
jgi:uncharacterized protein DUF4153